MIDMLLGSVHENNKKIARQFYIFILSAFFIFICQTASASTTSYYVYDSPNRSITAVLDSSQNVVNTYHYTDFGNVTSEIESVPNNYKYNGEQNESETSLILFRIICIFMAMMMLLGLKERLWMRRRREWVMV